MKKIFTLLFTLSIFSSTNAQIACVDSSLIDPTAMCTFIYNPVCGCNGVTYNNDCLAEVVGGVTSWTPGPCGSSSVPGCMDPTAVNYDPLATIDDGSCIYNPPSSSICEDFDSFQAGDPIAQTSPDWETWGSITAPNPPYADDANVTNNMASSGNNSLYFEAVGAGGPQDVVLPFGAIAPYDIGIFEFSSMFYVNSGTGAYFNFQAETLPGQVWSLDCKMDLGVLVLENTGSGLNYLSTSYPQAQWFEIKLICDLTNNNWELFIDGVTQGSFTNTINKIASLDLYPITGHQFYVDDVCWSYTAPVLENLNAQVVSVAPITGLNTQSRIPSVDVRNLGVTNITSFDVDFDYNGVTVTENITGVNLSTVDVYQVNFTTPITLVSGTNIGTATVYNVNGLGPDDDPSDDDMSIQINAITPAPGKLVVGEEATGTWCGWCPRGAVALNWMDHDYEGFWQGIAVHNGDPMTDADYDNGMASLISGYPSGIVDRGPDIDPGDFKQDFLQRIVVQPKAIIENGAELNGNILTVNLTAGFTIPATGNFKFVCVLVEDSVTGFGSSYNQSNSYSGGSTLIDVDGTDWSTLQSTVPASQMIYRHVARGVAPSFTGAPLTSSAFVNGDTETVCFEFTLDPSWDQSKIHIVGMLIDNTNRVDNASSTTISEAINNGLSSECITATNIGMELNGPDRVNIYPNPASDNIYISNLIENSQMKIFDITGKLVFEAEVADKEYVNISELSKGIYQINFVGSNFDETRQLIIE
ncbi:T9SS type A sorting domain-containing protein [Flavobacteriales bacterium]|nr:T9SS type A sorting domain-containing protein [Flavobacteriales bacterium]